MTTSKKQTTLVLLVALGLVSTTFGIASADITSSEVSRYASRNQPQYSEYYEDDQDEDYYG